MQNNYFSLRALKTLYPQGIRFMNSQCNTLVWYLLFVLWAGLVGLGILYIIYYSNQPSPTRPTPDSWPVSTELKLAKDKPTLLLFMHPYCSCSHATLENLARLVAHIHGKASIYILFLSPDSLPVDWYKTESWHQASEIPGIHVLADTNGHIAQQFQATTSGQVLLYSPRGQKWFSGGITPSRSHAGDNKGSLIIEHLILTHSKSDTYQTFVFGCPIFNL